MSCAEPSAGVVESPAHRYPESKVRVGRLLLWSRIILFTALAYFILFRLPFWFPPHQQLVSASYAFGFNNSVAIAGLGVLIGIVSLYYFLERKQWNGPLIQFYSVAPAKPLLSTLVVLIAVGLGYAGLTFLMYVYDKHSAPWLTWETRHLLHRTWVTDVYKLQPYTQIAAEYGPILTYAPLYIYWLLKPLGASHEQAYFVCHLLLNLAGLWCGWYVLSGAGMPTRARVIAFILVAIAGFGPWMGVNGVLVRYLFPFAALLLGHRVITLMLSGLRSIAWSSGVVASILLLLVGNILLSPEIGVAFALAWFGYAVLMSRGDLRILALSLIALAAAAVLGWLFLPAAYYGTLLRFSEGANNLPLLPAPHLLLYILTLFILVPQLLAASVTEPRLGDVGGASICGALGILCIVMAPGALGRCDPPHVLFYGMGACMLLMIYLANISWRAFVTYTAAYFVVCVVLMQLVNALVFYGISPQVIFSRNVVPNTIERFRASSNTRKPDLAKLSTLDRFPRIGLPFASFGNPAVERYVLSRGKLDPEYYVAVVGVYNAEGVKRKLRDVSKMEHILIPDNLKLNTVSSSEPASPCAGYLKSLRQWFLYPAKLPCRAEPLDANAALRSFIADHFTVIDHIDSWLLLRRNDDASSP